MKTLLLLRHAKSSWDHVALADHERPLNNRGQNDAPRMGRLISQKNLNPGLIIASTAKRAQETAHLVAQECRYPLNAIQSERSLYDPGLNAYLSILTQIPNQVNIALLIAHNPDLEEFLSRHTGQKLLFPTAALAQLELPITSWEKLCLSTKAKLINLWRPREIEK